MPVLALELSLALDWRGKVLFPTLQDEPHLSGHTEVGDTEKRDLLKEGLSGQLALVASLGKHVCLEAHWLQLHDVADVEGVHPLVLVEEAKHRVHVDSTCEEPSL